MISFLLVHQAQIRECINGAIAVLCFNLAIVVAVHLQSAWRYLDIPPARTIRRYRKLDGVPVACVLFWTFLFESNRAGSVWWIYHSSSSRTPFDLGNFALTAVAETANYLATGIGFIAMLLWLTWYFAPPDKQDTATMTSGVAALVMVLFSIFHTTS